MSQQYMWTTIQLSSRLRDEVASRSKPQDIVQLVLELSRTLMNNFDSRLADLNLTFPQAVLLHQLGEALPMNEVAGKLHCDPSNVTGIVDRLEARGLVKRQPSPTDRRVKNLVLTPTGKRIRRRVDAILSEIPGVGTLAAADQTALRDLLARSLSRK
jgi:DNA-binding MarR family transcriptional regulator